MKKPINFFLFTFIFLFSTLTVFADNALINIGDILSRKSTYYNIKDIGAQIQLREAEIRANNSEVKYIDLQRTNVIKRDNLSPWDCLFNAEVKGFSRQIKVLEDLNKRWTKEISQLNKTLRKLNNGG
jgi:hypothetical protein